MIATKDSPFERQREQARHLDKPEPWKETIAAIVRRLEELEARIAKLEAFRECQQRLSSNDERRFEEVEAKIEGLEEAVTALVHFKEAQQRLSYEHDLSVKRLNTMTSDIPKLIDQLRKDIVGDFQHSATALQEAGLQEVKRQLGQLGPLLKDLDKG